MWAAESDWGRKSKLVLLDRCSKYMDIWKGKWQEDHLLNKNFEWSKVYKLNLVKQPSIITDWVYSEINLSCFIMKDKSTEGSTQKGMLPNKPAAQAEGADPSR